MRHQSAGYGDDIGGCKIWGAKENVIGTMVQGLKYEAPSKGKGMTEEGVIINIWQVIGTGSDIYGTKIQG